MEGKGRENARLQAPTRPANPGKSVGHEADEGGAKGEAKSQERPPPFDHELPPRGGPARGTR